MTLSYPVLRPIFHTLSSLTTQLEKGTSPSRFLTQLEPKVAEWIRNQDLDYPLMPLRVMAKSDTPYAEVKVEQIGRILLETGRRVQQKLDPDDSSARGALNALNGRWAALVYGNPLLAGSVSLFPDSVSSDPASQSSSELSGPLFVNPAMTLLKGMIKVFQRPMGFFVLDPSVSDPREAITVLMLNPANEQASGFTEAEITSINLHENVHPKDLSKFVGAIPVMLTEGYIELENFRLKKSDGEYLIARLHVALMEENLQGKRLGYFIMFPEET